MTDQHPPKPTWIVALLDDIKVLVTAQQVLVGDGVYRFTDHGFFDAHEMFSVEHVISVVRDVMDEPRQGSLWVTTVRDGRTLPVYARHVLIDSGAYKFYNARHHNPHVMLSIPHTIRVSKQEP